MTGLHRHGQGTAGAGAGHVGRRVPEDDSPGVAQARLIRTALGHGDERVAIHGVPAVGPDPETVREPDGVELHAGPRNPVPRQEREVHAAFQRVEEVDHARAEFDTPRHGQTTTKRREVGVLEGRLVVGSGPIDPVVAEARGHAADNRPIRAAADGDAPRGVGPAAHVKEGLVKGLPPRSARTENRAVDVEEEEQRSYHGVVRMYHPDYVPSWLERLGELFDMDRPDPEPSGADLTFLRRAASRDVQAFVDGRFALRHLGWGLVRVDSNLRLPADPVARRVTCGHLVRRVRIAQVVPQRSGVAHPTVIPYPARWYQFEDVGGGTSVRIRLIDTVPERWPWHLSVDLSTGPEPEWTEPEHDEGR